MVWTIRIQSVVRRRWLVYKQVLRQKTQLQLSGSPSNNLSPQKKSRGKPHPRNTFTGVYNMDRLIAAYPSLEPHIIRTRLGEPCRPTINYFNPESVRALNTALLVADYNVNPKYNEILPTGALSPPVPGRADYVHYIADILKQSWPDDVIPIGVNVVGMDIGTGASAIYPTIATAVYGWKMIASEINLASIESAKLIAHANDSADLIDVRHQQSKKSIFHGVLQRGEKIDFAMCNPPFYSSIEAFQKENARKLAGLAKGGSTLKEQSLGGGSNNFGGTDSELWCEGGEVAFVKRMINESKQYADKCLWFSSLVSRKDNIKRIEGSLFNMGKNKGGKQRIQVQEVRRIAMGAGHKSSTILFWTYFDEQRRTDWARMRWC